MNNFDYFIGGAEKQAATSIAQAYPNLNFQFLSDKPVIDGWDLDNVTIQYESHANKNKYSKNKLIPIHQLWSNHQKSLLTTLNHLHDVFGSQVLPISNTPLSKWSNWIVKGNNFHKPDGLIIGNQDEGQLPQEYLDCEYVYQEYFPNIEYTTMVSGRFDSKSEYCFGCFKILSESIAREDSIVAAESFSNEKLIEFVLNALSSLEYHGFFTINFISINGKFIMTSFRPAPKAIFRIMMAGGLDLLGSGNGILKSGLKLIGNIHYSSYRKTTL